MRADEASRRQIPGIKQAQAAGIESDRVFKLLLELDPSKRSIREEALDQIPAQATFPETTNAVGRQIDNFSRKFRAAEAAMCSGKLEGVWRLRVRVVPPLCRNVLRDRHAFR